MKSSLLPLLACPSCRSELELAGETPPSDEVLEGNLQCRSSHQFPIRRGIPEFTGDIYAKSFSVQWHLQSTNARNEALSRDVKARFLSTVGISVDQLAGRRILDAGCGRGVLVELLMDAGAEVVGIDLSDGVLDAVQRVQGRANGHVVRADILNLPFREGSFDNIFSMGVLHHTRNCREAFHCLTRLLRPGGSIAVWVYSAYSRYRNACSDILRKVSTRMPHRLLYALCHLAVPLDRLQRIPFLGLPFRVIPVAGGGPWRWVVLGTFDWYSPCFQSKHTFPEVFQWFEEAGLEKIRIHDWGIAVSGRKPLDLLPVQRNPGPVQPG